MKFKYRIKSHLSVEERVSRTGWLRNPESLKTWVKWKKTVVRTHTQKTIPSFLKAFRLKEYNTTSCLPLDTLNKEALKMPEEPQNKQMFKRNVSQGIEFCETTINGYKSGKGESPVDAGVLPGRALGPQS